MTGMRESSRNRADAYERITTINTNQTIGLIRAAQVAINKTPLLCLLFGVTLAVART